MTTARLTRSREDYLKALFALDGGSRAVTVTQVARRLHVSLPSATNMLARLARETLVTRAARGEARLTPLGQRRALETLRRHRVLETFLVRALGLDWAEAHEDAEVLEHAVSDRVLDAMDRALGHPHEDPHGHPIPDRRGRIARRALVTIASLAPGVPAVVREVGDGDRAFMARCRRAGLVPGARVSVTGQGDALEVAGARLAVPPARFSGVLVEPAAKAARRARASTGAASSASSPIAVAASGASSRRAVAASGAASRSAVAASGASSRRASAASPIASAASGASSRRAGASSRRASAASGRKLR